MQLAEQGIKQCGECVLFDPNRLHRNLGPHVSAPKRHFVGRHPVVVSGTDVHHAGAAQNVARGVRK